MQYSHWVLLKDENTRSDEENANVPGSPSVLPTILCTGMYLYATRKKARCDAVRYNSASVTTPTSFFPAMLWFASDICIHNFVMEKRCNVDMVLMDLSQMTNSLVFFIHL